MNPLGSGCRALTFWFTVEGLSLKPQSMSGKPQWAHRKGAHRKEALARNLIPNHYSCKVQGLGFRV